MTRLVVDSREPDARPIEAAAAVLRQGGIVAYPTDTLYAFAVDPRNDGAVRRLFALKGRDAAAAIALIAADDAQAEEAGAFGPAARRLAAEFWPGPLTLVVQAAAGMSPLLSGSRGTLGVRVPAHAVARALAAAAGTCITATSANRSGEQAPVTADGVAAAFDSGIDMLLDAGPSPGGAPSTVLEIAEGRPVLHRAGAVSWDRVIESLLR